MSSSLLGSNNIQTVPNCGISFINPSDQEQSTLFQYLPPELIVKILKRVVSGTFYQSAVDSVAFGRVCKLFHHWLHPAFIQERLCSPSLCSHPVGGVHDHSRRVFSPILALMNDVADELYSCLLVAGCEVALTKLNSNQVDLKNRIDQCLGDARKKVPFLVCKENKQFLFPIFFKMLKNKPIEDFEAAVTIADLYAEIFMNNEIDQKGFNDKVLTYLSNHLEDYNF